MSREKVRKQSLFFDKTTTPAIKAEVAAFTSASATGARVADCFYGWAAHARNVLSGNDEVYPRWAGEQPAVPEWVDPEYPEHAWHLICLVAQGLPKHAPPEGCNLTSSEQRASEVLLRLSRVQEAVRPLADRLEQVFPLIEASISLGTEVVAATVEPYEKNAAIHHNAERRLIESNQGTPVDSPNGRRRADNEQRNRDIKILAGDYMRRVGRDSENEAARWIAEKHPDFRLSVRQLRRIIAE
ncbi:hypothetical protein [Marinobacterium weihaiense]|uniref:Uncharacterized protein n=1 Tax=Marinobacterium weihaiense TaxID=2851016 RepID=A0ABS6M7Y7_9GAMM|nr:hypothetical protein [Marinobacterium weihaiense]MBV0932367.1 hypothetical protein [Marinobacterium weihaiense]